MFYCILRGRIIISDIASKGVQKVIFYGVPENPNYSGPTLSMFLGWSGETSSSQQQKWQRTGPVFVLQMGSDEAGAHCWHRACWPTYLREDLVIPLISLEESMLLNRHSLAATVCYNAFRYHSAIA